MKSTGVSKSAHIIRVIADKIIEIFFPEPHRASDGEAYCTYRGMAKKMALYVIMLVLGHVGYFVLHYIFLDLLGVPTQTLSLSNDFKTKFFEEGTYTLTYIEWMIFFITTLSVSLTPILRYLPRGAVFFDTLYCISVGYNTSFMYRTIVEKDSRVAIFTVLITVFLCFIPYYLFRYRKIKLPSSFADIVNVLFWIIVMGSGILGVLCAIPVINVVAEWLLSIYNLPVVGEFLLIGRVIIYFLFLFTCMENIIIFTRKKAPIKYEWMMTFHLMYTITIMMNYCIYFVMAHTDDIEVAIKLILRTGDRL